MWSKCAHYLSYMGNNSHITFNHLGEKQLHNQVLNELLVIVELFSIERLVSLPLRAFRSIADHFLFLDIYRFRN